MNARLGHLSTWRMGLGLAAAAVMGVISYMVLELGTAVVGTTLVDGGELNSLSVFNAALAFMIFGVPIALVLSLAVGLPIWKFAEARRLRSRRSALILGASTGAVIYLLLIFLPQLYELLAYKSNHNSWQAIPGALPGWFYALLYVMKLAVAGCIGGLTAHWVAFSAVRSAEIH